MSTDTKTSDKLQAALEKEQQARNELEKRRRKTRDLMIEDHLDSHAGHQKISKKVEKVRAALHRHRLNMGRKRFSIRTQEKRLAETKEDLAEQAKEEEKIVAELDDLEAQQEKIKDRIAREVRAKHEEPARRSGARKK